VAPAADRPLPFYERVIEVSRRSRGTHPVQRITVSRLALAACGLLWAPLPAQTPADPVCPAGGTTLRWETFAIPFFQQNCTPCHSWQDSYTLVYEQHVEIWNLVTAGTMPPGKRLPEPLKASLGEWIGCDLPLDGPGCPSTGTTLSYQLFGRQFFSDHCSRCHSKDLPEGDRGGAPLDQNWDVYDSVVKYGPRIREDVLKGLMPPDDWVPPEEAQLLLQWIGCGMPQGPPDHAFRRGDANGDGVPDISDVVGILLALFLGGPALDCPDAADTDASGAVDLTDAVDLLDYLFLEGPPPPPPFSSCGQAVLLGCAASDGCP
jgi:hypothetical protein